MNAQLKCSNCGAEISNFNLSWGKKYWYWFIPFLILMISLPFLMQYVMKDRNDFMSDLSVRNTEKSYINGTIEILGIVENHGKVNWKNIVIKADLFDKNGKIIDVITKGISVTVPPATSEHFKICSKEFPESRWNSISDLKVKVADAYHVKF